MSTSERATPVALTPGWPEVISTDPAAEAVRLFAVALRRRTLGLSARQVGERCGINHAVYTRILRGETWPDARSIARLETGLEARLWPAFGEAGYDLAASQDGVVHLDGADEVRDRDVTPGTSTTHE